jgi:alanyl-tRNA synthetase
VKASEIRNRFLSFYEKRGHTIVQSASLIPHNDPTLFFVNAGMVPFKDVFTGVENRSYTRATSSQKCLRVSGKHNDLENVGRTPRHHTLFEMLGNFSFGDYFKRDAITMAWELFTKELGIDPDRIWVTVFEDDDEAYEIWRDVVGFPEERLQRLGAKENFWSMGPVGPCGPCSELHYDYGEEISSCTKGPAGETDRYVEFCNLVFMQYNQLPDGTRVPLAKPSIDTGSGLERVAAILQGVHSNYDTDLFAPIIARAASVCNVKFGAAKDTDDALRVISDHARATAFLIADGVMPSNEGRGYVLRRIMRRAIRFGVKVGVTQNFFHEVTAAVVENFGQQFPELSTRASFIAEVVEAEESGFRSTLIRGIALLNAELAKVGNGGELGGSVAFTLSDTYGFPLDLTQQIAQEIGSSVDVSGYNLALEQQKSRGRAAWKGSGEQAVSALWRDIAEQIGLTNFTGYEGTTGVGHVVGLFAKTEDEITAVDTLKVGQSGIMLSDRTPAYAESGGQVGDTGCISWSGGRAQLSDTSKVAGLHLHTVTVEDGELSSDSAVTIQVDEVSRMGTQRNHSATHLLHQVLKEVLGEHVAQKGSLVGPNRLRFDFSHHKSVGAEELVRIEAAVNAAVLENVAVTTAVMTLDEAKASGAMALFGEKYDSDVRVVSMGSLSLELCGGTHVTRTGDIGPFRLVSESGIAAGVRRIEAQTGLGAWALVSADRTALQEMSTALKCQPDTLMTTIQKLTEERRALSKQLGALEKEAAKAAAGDIIKSAVDMDGVNVLIAEVQGDLREQADRLRDQLGSAVLVLFAARGPKVQVLVAATKDIAGTRVHAGNLIKEIAPLVGGRGGGRPDMAQAGGSDPSAITAAIQASSTIIETALRG